MQLFRPSFRYKWLPTISRILTKFRMTRRPVHTVFYLEATVDFPDGAVNNVLVDVKACVNSVYWLGYRSKGAWNYILGSKVLAFRKLCSLVFRNLYNSLFRFCSFLCVSVLNLMLVIVHLRFGLQEQRDRLGPCRSE